MGPREKPRRTICHCLQVSEEDVLEAIFAHEIRDIEDITRYTQAGDGCTACHPALRKLCEKTISRDPRRSAPKDNSQVLAA